MLKFILGTNKTSKTEYLSEEAVNLLLENKKVLILVPEQYTLVWERIILKKKPRNLVNLEVLNFNRLYNYAMKYNLQLEKKFINNTGKKLLMYLAMQQVHDNFLLYKNKISVSFITKLLDILDEFVDYNISLDLLEKKIELVENNTTKQKLHDIILMLNAYFALLEQSGYSKSSELQELSELIKTTDFLKDTTIVLDGFDTFTPLEYSIVNRMIVNASGVIISLTTDTNEDKDGGYGVFSTIKSTYAKLANTAVKYNVKIENETLCQIKYANDELLYLEQNIFRKSEKYEEKAENIVVYGAKDVFNESDYIASEISKLIYEKKADYKDIVIIGRDSGSYLGILDYMLDKYEIPYFYDRRSEILSKPLVIYIITLLNIATYKLDSINLFTLLKTGLTSLTSDEICLLENYISKWNIKPSELANGMPFDKSPKGFGNSDKEKEKQELENLTQLKYRATGDIITFCKNIKNKTAKEISIILYNYLIEQEIPKKTADLSNIYTKKSEFALAAENKQILNIIIEVLDQFVTALSDKNISIKVYKDLFEYVLSDVSVGKIPTSLNEVFIGDVDRIRVEKPKYVFVLGLNDGVFPSVIADDKIITAYEREKLETLGINLSKAYNEQIFVERFYGYKAFSLASCKLFLSYVKTAQDGKESYMSYFLKTVLKLIPNLQTLDFSTRELKSKIYRELPAIEILASKYNFKNIITEVKILDDYFSEKLGSKYLNQIIGISKFTKDEKVQSKEKLQKICTSQIKMSSTKAENYFNCKYEYFCKYILNLKPNRKISFDLMQIGSFVHHVLEKAFIKANEKEGGIASLTNEEIIKISKTICDEYLKEYMQVEKSNQRFLYIFNRLSKTVVKLLINISNEFSQSDFVTTAIEMKIGKDGINPMEIQLDNGATLSLIGVVDRVDILEKNGKKYVRIIDYKTGSKEFLLSDINNGLNLQLLIYLFSILENGKAKLGDNLNPAGVLYFPATTKILSEKRNVSEIALKEKRIDELKMDGLLLDNKEIISAMEKDLEGKYINVKANKDDGITGGKLATLEQFSKLKNYLEKLLCEMGNGILSGDIKINPYKDYNKPSGKNSCKYCEFNAVCGMEPGKGNPRKFEKVDKKEFWEKMQ